MTRRYDNDYDSSDYSPRRRPSPHHQRQPSPDYHSGGSRFYANGANPSGPVAQSPFYPPPQNGGGDSGGFLQVPQAPNRPRSTPPYSMTVARQNYQHHNGGGGGSPYNSDSEDNGQDYGQSRHSRHNGSTSGGSAGDGGSVVSRAKTAMDKTFSQSTSGLGVAVLGAIVGGLAAREATEATHRRRSKHGHGGTRSSQDTSTLISTVIGAAVGGIGANALEKRIEVSRTKSKSGHEQRWGSTGGSSEKTSQRSLGRGDTRRHTSENLHDDGDDDDSESDYVYDRRTIHRRPSDAGSRYRA